ncbi:FtsX-like permease family protein [Actinoplanes sp. NPDC051859]|uniref:FtsX-like permease family protein n=1 Tax=Actinoplanes sp. NPDC051859 TaxID=3363909 RepID=UPI0037AC0949
MSSVKVGFVGSWRVAMRIARRAAWRHKASSAFVLLMLFLPAYAGTILVASWANLSGTATQQAQFSLGSADFSVSTENPEAVTSTLPSGARVAVIASGETVLKTGQGLAVYPYESTDAGDPVNDGRYVLRAGRIPAAAGEVAFTSAMADASGIRLHDVVEVGIPLRRVTVVGLLDVSRSLRAKEIVASVPTPLSGAAGRRLLIDLPADGAGWSPPRSPGISSIDRRDLAPTTGEMAVQAAALSIIASFAGAQIIALTGAAFMATARRQQRQLRMVSAVGATARQVQRMVLASGILLSTLAAASGVLLGLATFLAAGPAIEMAADHPLIDVSVPPWPIAAVAAVVISIGLAAAYLPARSVGRQRAPRSHLGNSRTRWGSETLLLVCGLAALTVGTAAVLYSANPDGRFELISGGAIALLVGLIGITPALMKHGGSLLARHLTLSSRLAVRHAARHYLRSASAVAAVTAAVAGSVALTLVAGAEEEGAPAPLAGRPGLVFVPPAAAQVLQADGIGRLAAMLPTRHVVELNEVERSRAGSMVAVEASPAFPSAADANLVAAAMQRRIAVGGAEMISAVAGRDPRPRELETLRNGGVIAFNDTLVTGEHLELAGDAGKRVVLPAIVARRGSYYTDLPGLLMAAETAQRLGFTTSRQGILVDTTRPPTEAELFQAQSLLLQHQLRKADTSGTPIVLTTYTGAPASLARTSAMFYVLVAVSAVVTMTASLVAVGLSSAEMRGDLWTMRAVGATSRVSRRIGAAQAALIVGVGAPLGLLAGIGPAAGYVAYNVTLSWRTPWLMLALVLLVPVVSASIVATMVNRTVQPLARQAHS